MELINDGRSEDVDDPLKVNVEKLVTPKVGGIDVAEQAATAV